jgi:glycosyltransferase involved in cell wall biosynthesis
MPRACLPKRVIGVVGSGMVGRDPFDPRCWSRSGYLLFTTLRDKGMLRRAFGVEVPHPLRGLLMARDFHPSRRLWSQRFNLDPAYYRALTRQIARGLRPDDFDPESVLLQIGGHYDASRASGGRIPAYSYHDGNIGGMMKSPYFPKENLPHARRAFAYEKEVYRDMTKIFVMSEYWRRSFVEDFAVDAARVVNVGFGVNVAIPDEPPKDYGRKSVVFVGIDFSRKGGENLLAAFARLSSRHPDAVLHVIGPRAVPAALKGPGLRGVEFHGHLSREVEGENARLLDILRGGTLFVLPSLYEPFGNAALEAMLYRMPVVATGDWSFPDFVNDRTGLLLKDPADVGELAEKMDAFLSDPELSRRAGEAGRRLVLERYTWDKTVDRLYVELG